MQSRKYSKYLDILNDFETLLRLIEKERLNHRRQEQKDEKDNKSSNNEIKSSDSQSKNFAIYLAQFQEEISAMLDSIDFIECNADQKDFLKDAKKYLESLQANLQGNSKSVLDNRAHTQLVYNIRRKSHLINKPDFSSYTFDRFMSGFPAWIRSINKSSNQTNKNDNEIKESKSEKQLDEIGLNQNDIDLNNLLRNKAIVENLKKNERDQNKIKILDDSLKLLYMLLDDKNKTEFSLTGLPQYLGMTIWRKWQGRTSEQLLFDIEENLNMLKKTGAHPQDFAARK